jgi:hypothetical protein
MGTTSPATIPTVPAPLSPLEALALTIPVESVTIASDAMPGHFTARAIILDLQPSQMPAAILVVEDRITRVYPHARRTGWSATSDGLRIWFYAWTPAPVAAAVAA